MLKDIRKFLQISVAVFLISFAFSCANIVAPSGGPKDITPPKAKQFEPLNYSTNFREKKIRITFSEFVDLADQANQIVVSPPTKEDFTFTVRGKSIVVDVPPGLQDSTTYTIYFGESIRDITEGNILSGFQYAFSTGPVMDSLSLRGMLTDAFTLEPAKGNLVMLYKVDNDSAPLLRKPDFLTKTDASGSFVLSNLKRAKYKIFALNDIDKDMKYNLPTESIGFADSLVTPQYVNTKPDTASHKADTLQVKLNKTDSIHQKKDTVNTKKDSVANKEIIRLVNLQMFVPADTVQKLLKARSENHGQFRLYFKQPVTDININLINKQLPENWKTDELFKNKDTLTCWLNNPELDTLKFTVFDNGKFIDTVDLVNKPKPDVKTKGNKPSGKGSNESEMAWRLAIKTNIAPNGLQPYFLPFQLTLSHPIEKTDVSKIALSVKVDSSFMPLTVNITAADSMVKRHYYLSYKWEIKKVYQLVVLPGAFTDIYGLVNDTLKMNFSANAVEDYGRLLFTYKSANFTCAYLVQLFNDSKVLVAQKSVSKEEQVIFENLVPGNYHVHVVRDVNGNGKWDAGNYFRKIQAEPMIFFQNTINIRANWDSDFEFKN